MEEKQIFTKRYNAKNKIKNGNKVLRTAAYCRVSTLMEEQELSYESQCAYYEQLISGDPDKDLVGIYGDHGVSGLHMEDRKGLQAMLQDCREGKIDLIITRSISRLARNVIECQRMLEELNGLGIPVIFQKEQLRSDNPQMTLILKLLISTAQEESNSISQSIKWAHDHSVKLGKPTRVCPYGYRKRERINRTDPHIWEIYEPEAEKIRLIFRMIYENKSSVEITDTLNEIEKQSGSDYRWKYPRIFSICRNEAYVGDILSNKTYRPDMLSASLCNNGEREQYYLEDHHPAIVDRDLFNEVQLIIESRSKPHRKSRKKKEEE